VSSEEEKRISRRKFVKGAAAASVGVGVLASCGPTPQVIKETVEVPVEKIVKETVEVPVEVTRIVEVAAEGVVEAGPVVLEVFDASGATEVSELHAARLDSLEGKTICELSNDSWGAAFHFDYLRELIQREYPTATIIPFTEFPTEIDSDEVADMVKERGCDAAIIGNAG
jgi:hypothetical protein